MPEEKADYVVNVVWKAQPFSTNYPPVDPKKRAILDWKVAEQVNVLIPCAKQSQWRNILLPQVDRWDIYNHMKERLSNELTPPPGTEFAFPSPSFEYVRWSPTPPTHTIMFNLQLADLGGANKRPWDFQVEHKGIVYDVRMVLSYDCVLDEP